MIGIVLCVLAPAIPAVWLGHRLYRDGWLRALTAYVLWFSLFTLPALWLGWLERLDETTIAAGVLGASAIALAFAKRGRPWSELRDALVWATTSPGRVLAGALRARHFAAVALALFYLTVAYSLVVVWLAPACNWDGLMYHEPIIQWAIQNGGFGVIDVPRTGFSNEAVNYAPRLSETFSLVFVSFRGRQLIDVGPSLVVPMVLLGFVVVAKRFTSTLNAICWAVALCGLPAVLLQIRSTYVDVFALAEFVAIVAYVSQRKLSLRDVWMAGLCLGLLSGTKYTAALLVPMYGGLLFLRVAWAALRRWRANERVGVAPVVASVLAPLVFAALIGGPGYLRNYQRWGNPLWPGKVSLPVVGTVFDGPFEPSFHMRTSLFMEVLFAPPNPGGQFADSGDNGYGNLAPFTLLPLAPFAILLLLGRAARRGGEDERVLALLTLPAIASLALSPSIDLARLNLHAVTAVFWVVAWMLRRGYGYALSAALVLSAVVTFYWSTPAWGVTFTEAIELAQLGPRARLAEGMEMTRCMDPALVRAREREIGAGDVSAYSVEVFQIALFWNESVSNEVHWVDARQPCPAFVARLDELEAEWVHLPERSRLPACVEGAGWEQVGTLDHPSFETRDHIEVWRRSSM